MIEWLVRLCMWTLRSWLILPSATAPFGNQHLVVSLRSILPGRIINKETWKMISNIIVNISICNCTIKDLLFWIYWFLICNLVVEVWMRYEYLSLLVYVYVYMCVFVLGSRAEVDGLFSRHDTFQNPRANFQKKETWIKILQVYFLRWLFGTCHEQRIIRVIECGTASPGLYISPALDNTMSHR